ncbi:diguanylate cyclase [Pseudonocardia sp. CA-107938]|uniref:GGDEF domain-containing protein n=1 Tax=Pseudonocardia sp. CA-107938 TaxID=3240021 RepID=UPI003D910B08
MIDPRGWKLWRLTTRSLTYVLLVDAIAVTLVGYAPDRPTGVGQWATFAALVAGMVGHAELARGKERLRRLGAPETVHITTDTVWIVAGMLLVPWPLVAGLIAATVLHLRLRVDRRTPLYRIVFSGAANLVSTRLAIEILAVGGVGPAQLPALGTTVVAVLAAIIVRDAAYSGLVAAAVVLANRTPPRLPASFAAPAVHAFEIAASALGVLLALMAVAQPALVPFVLLQLVVLDHAAQFPVVRDLARIDGKTGLLNPTRWDDVAHRELARALRHHQPVGLLMLDVDHFRTINERHSHLVGDMALRAVAATISQHLPVDGVAGRFGGEEFAVLLCDTTPDELAATAETLRTRIAELTVPTRAERPALTVTVSLGGSHSDQHPHTDPGAMLTDLLLAADSALFRAKAEGRNRVHLATGTASPRRDPG